MALFINGIGCISPQHTFDNSVFLPEVKVHTTNRLACVDPDYSSYFDSGSIRRMGKLMKYGTAAGLIALKDADVKIPGAISTGTGLGLPEISQKFLKSLIEAEETIVSPTAFIQSTHNTVSSNIALLCGCHAHNNTFSHKGFSFESALIDAQMLALEDTDNILVGAYDEVSDYKYAASKKVGEVRPEPCLSSETFSDKSNGILAGEGAAFFVLSKEATEKSYGQFIGNKNFYRPDNIEEIQSHISTFLTENNISVTEIDVLITGLNGETQNDAILSEVTKRMFTEQTIVAYKHLCGEYMTSSAFAFWLAAQMMKWQRIPDEVILENKNRQPHNILLYNSYKANHSLMLFKNV
jgi:3-oxoacyl-(acyl-carrier-protein) synthase